MGLPTHILLTYGYWLLFFWVLLEQLGIPVPATPVLLAAGALTAEREMSLPMILLCGVVACLLADLSWFLLGRRFGPYIMRLLCKLSLEPTICVRRTQDSFGRRGAVTLLFAKFVPGLGTVAPPVAGQNGMSLRTFLLFDTAGSTIWVLTLALAGRFFGDLLNRDPRLLNWVGQFAGALLVLGILGFLAWRIYRKQAFVKRLHAARLEPQELKAILDAGEPVYIVDLRHPLELVAEPNTLPGALHLSPSTIAERHGEIPRDRDIVLYCSCPSEATAAKTAMTLHKLGIERVRPLRGGLDEWKRLGYPLQAIPPVIPPPVLITPAMIARS